LRTEAPQKAAVHDRRLLAVSSHRPEPALDPKVSVVLKRMSGCTPQVGVKVDRRFWIASRDQHQAQDEA